MRANVQVGKGALCVGGLMVLALGAVAVMLPFQIGRLGQESLQHGQR